MIEVLESQADVDLALLRAASHSERRLAGGLTHDLNSALQCLGDALFGIREDVLRAVDERAADGSLPTGDLLASLRLADDAFDRLNNVALAVPNLVPQTAPGDSGPINLGLELLNLVPLTAHHWRHRLEVVVDVEPNTAPFWCAWWVARLAVLRLMLSTMEGHRTVKGDETARLRLSGSRRNDIVEVTMVIEGRAPEAEGGVAVPAAEDPLIALCLQRLGGDVLRRAAANGTGVTVLRFPVAASVASGLEPVR